MSQSSRLNDDACAYTHTLRQSVGVGAYQLHAPRVECQSCFAKDPTVRLQKRGGARCPDRASVIDAHSDLLGLTRKASNCPTQKYLPGPNGTVPSNCTLAVPPDCTWQSSREDTRLSNPPCTLRGTGWNRWAWLCQDPQDRALLPFDTLVQNRLVVKDNHRPCLPCPLNPTAALPPHNSDDRPMLDSGELPPCAQGGGSGCAVGNGRRDDHHLPSVHWRTCASYKPYLSAK
jgi:hypothetical protein